MANALALLRTDFPHYHIIPLSQETSSGPSGPTRAYAAYHNGADGKDGPFVAQAASVAGLRIKLDEIDNEPRSRNTSTARRAVIARGHGRRFVSS